MADAPTPVVPAATGAANNYANGTAEGIYIYVSGLGMADSDPKVAGQVVVGAGVNVYAEYVGSGWAGGAISNVRWNIAGATADTNTATAIAGYGATQAAGTVSVLTPSDLSQVGVHYYYLPDGNQSDLRSVDVSAVVGGTDYHAKTQIRVLTPHSTFTGIPWKKGFTVGPNASGRGLNLTPNEYIYGGASKNPPGMTYNATVGTNAIEAGGIELIQPIKFSSTLTV